jgi:exopolyphosphatase/guanosine-5'-triphosphate,3'-diphosphate pyrophosphatase
LSDIAWREHPDYRPEHAFTRALRLPVAGITHAERVIVALILAIRYGGGADAPFIDPVRSLITEEDVAFAERVGATIRLAYSLSGGTPHMLGLTSIEKSSAKLTKGGETLFGEAVQRRLDAVGRAFALPTVIG